MSKCVAVEGTSQSQFEFGELTGNRATWLLFSWQRISCLTIKVQVFQRLYADGKTEVR